MTTIKIKKVQNLITARPEGMDFETYKQLRREQHVNLHGYKDANGRRHPGRLDGIYIPANIYQGHSSDDFQIVIK